MGSSLAQSRPAGAAAAAVTGERITACMFSSTPHDFKVFVGHGVSRTVIELGIVTEHKATAKASRAQERYSFAACKVDWSAGAAQAAQMRTIALCRMPLEPVRRFLLELRFCNQGN